MAVRGMGVEDESAGFVEAHGLVVDEPLLGLIGARA